MSARGGAGRGQGRKPLSVTEPSKKIQVRVTPTQLEKFKKLGGAEWLRKKIDEA